MNKQVLISVGGFVIRLFSGLHIRLDAGYSHFVCEPDRPADIEVECLAVIPEGFLTGAERVFKAANSEKIFYTIYRTQAGLAFVVNDQNTKDEIQQLALLDDTLKTWKIWSRPVDDALEPLLFPMGPILFHYATLQGDAVMMHSSCVFDGEKGRLFSGFSGAGKSTISGLWVKSGATMINDDRVIIRHEEDAYYVYNTPMYYADVPKRTRLDAVYLISHAPENKMTQRTGASAVTGIMAFSIQNNYDARFVQHHLTFFSEMCQSVPVYDLGFVPDESVVRFVKASPHPSPKEKEASPLPKCRDLSKGEGVRH